MSLRYMDESAKRAIYRGGGRRNLFQLWLDSWPEERKYGEQAYPLYQSTLQQMAWVRNMPLSTVTGVFAALSPNNGYKSNMMDTARMLDHYLAQLPRASLSVHTYGPNTQKAWRIVDGESPATVLPHGSKTWNFWHNITWPDDDAYVTVDGHMLNAWTHVKVPMDQASLIPRLYQIIKADVQSIARFVRVPASVFQATCWVAWRRLGGQEDVAARQMSLWGWEELMTRVGSSGKGSIDGIEGGIYAS